METSAPGGAMHPATADPGFSAANNGLVAVGADVPDMMNW
jgi:hypothetical protein